MDMRRDSFLFSGLLHLALLLVIIFGLPQFREEIPVEDKVMVVDIIRIEKPTVPAPVTPQEIGRRPKPEPRKSVVQTQPPQRRPEPVEPERQITREEPKARKIERRELVERRLQAQPTEMPAWKPQTVEQISDAEVKPIERRIDEVRQEVELSKREADERAAQLSSRDPYEAKLREQQDLKTSELKQAELPATTRTPETPRQRELELAKLERQNVRERDAEVARKDPALAKKLFDPSGWIPSKRMEIPDSYIQRTETVALPDDVRERTERLADAPPEHKLSVLERIQQSLKLATGRELDDPRRAQLEKRETRDVNLAASAEEVRRRESAAAELPEAAARRAEPARSEQALLTRVAESKRERDVVVRERETVMERPRDEADLAKWEHARRSADERKLQATQAALPQAVRESVDALAAGRPDAIRAQDADVGQQRGLSARAASAEDLARQKQEREKMEVNAPGAPVDLAVARPARATGPVPAASARAAALQSQQPDRIDRTVARQVTRAAVIEVEEVEAAAATDRPMEGPSGWRVERREQSERAVTALAAAALPSDRASRENVGTLSAGVAPVSADVGLVEQGRTASFSASPDVPLMPDAPARAATAGSAVTRDLSAPVEVARRNSAAPRQPAMSEKNIDGLKQSTAAPADRSFALAPAATRTTMESVESRPSLAVPDEEPEEWKLRDIARREAPKEKYEIDRREFVMSRELELQKTGAPAVASAEPAKNEPMFYERKIQTIGTEVDIMTLSERPMAPSPHGAGGASADYSAGSGEGRKLVRQAEPDIPKWFKERGEDAVGTFVLVISEEGEVTSVDIERTTGSKDMDQVCVATLMKYRYEPTGQADLKRLRYRIKLQKQ